MEAADIQKLIQQETRGLPENALSEILDFILFLKQKLSSHTSRDREFEFNINRELNELNSTGLTHLEEEFRGYRDLYPHEK
jgi:hypothetical protein